MTEPSEAPADVERAGDKEFDAEYPGFAAILGIEADTHARNVFCNGYRLGFAAAAAERERLRACVAWMLARLREQPYPNTEPTWAIWERMAIEFFPHGDYSAALSSGQGEERDG